MTDNSKSTTFGSHDKFKQNANGLAAWDYNEESLNTKGKVKQFGSCTCQQGWNIRKGEQDRKQEDYTHHKADRYRP